MERCKELANGKRIAVVGLDGLSFKYLNKLFKHGVIPYIKHLMNKGVSRTLYAFPPSTPPSWTSIMTGVNLGKHGIYDFYHIDKNYNQVFASAEFLEHPRIFEMLGLIGFKSIIINPVPGFPLYRVENTYQISHSFFTPKTIFFPKELERYASKLPVIPSIHTLEGMLDKHYEYIKHYLEIIEMLIEKYDYKLFWINLSVPDAILHKAHTEDFLTEKIVRKEKEIFVIVDNIIKLLDQHSDNLFIVSDHGFSSYRYILYINTILWKKKIVKTAEKGIADLSELLGQDVGITGITHKKPSRKTIIINPDNPIIKMLRTKPLTPIRISVKKVLKKLIGRKIDIRAFYHVDPRGSDAFLVSSLSHGVKVNSPDRINVIVETLRGIEGIKKVYRREELFHGPFLDRLPELFIVPDYDNGYIIDGVKVYGDPAIKKHNVLSHHPHGVFIAKSLSADYVPEIIDNYMVANIVMKELGVPLSSMADGLNVLAKMYREKIDTTPIYINRWRLLKRLKKIIVKKH